MRLEIADSPETVFSAAIDIARIVGSVKRSNNEKRSLIVTIRNGVDLTWEPVSIQVSIETLSDRTVLHAVADQKQIDGLPDQRETALQVFSRHLRRRKDLTVLD